MDYYESNKKNQFKDIQLQLHATSTVSNPYTFSIQGNKSFSSSSCTLSNADTALFNGNIKIGNSIKIVIPNDVKVLKVDVKFGDLVNENNNKAWSFYIFNDNSMSYSVYTNYIGVTPNKTYTLSAISSWYYESHSSLSVKIYYSASINNKKVFVSDY